MLKRLWQLINARIRAATADDILVKAQREVSRLRVQHRERSVLLLTERNNLQEGIKSAQRRIEILKARVKIAADEHEAQRLQKEIEEREESLATKQGCLEQARSAIEEANASLRRDEEVIRQKTAETLLQTANWKESAILREMRREWEVYSPTIERYQINPCFKTFLPLQEMHEAARQKLVQSEQRCDDLTLVASRLEAIIERLRRKVRTAEAEGDEETALRLNLEQVSYEKLRLSAQEAARQADESLANLRIAFAGQEAYMERETSHIEARAAADDA